MLEENLLKYIWGAFSPQPAPKFSLSSALCLSTMLLGIGFAEYYLSCFGIKLLQEEAGWSNQISMLTISGFFILQAIVGLFCLRYYANNLNTSCMKKNYYEIVKVILAFKEGFQKK